MHHGYFGHPALQVQAARGPQGVAAGGGQQGLPGMGAAGQAGSGPAGYPQGLMPMLLLQAPRPIGPMAGPGTAATLAALLGSQPMDMRGIPTAVPTAVITPTNSSAVRHAASVRFSLHENLKNGTYSGLAVEVFSQTYLCKQVSSQPIPMPLQMQHHGSAMSLGLPPSMQQSLAAALQPMPPLHGGAAHLGPPEGMLESSGGESGDSDHDTDEDDMLETATVAESKGRDASSVIGDDTISAGRRKTPRFVWPTTKRASLLHAISTVNAQTDFLRFRSKSVHASAWDSVVRMLQPELDGNDAMAAVRSAKECFQRLKRSFSAWEALQQAKARIAPAERVGEAWNKRVEDPHIRKLLVAAGPASAHIAELTALLRPGKATGSDTVAVFNGVLPDTDPTPIILDPAVLTRAALMPAHGAADRAPTDAAEHVQIPPAGVGLADPIHTAVPEPPQAHGVGPVPPLPGDAEGEPGPERAPKRRRTSPAGIGQDLLHQMQDQHREKVMLWERMMVAEDSYRERVMEQRERLFTDILKLLQPPE